MSVEQNKATSRRWYIDMFSDGHLEIADQICTPDYHNIDPYAPPGGWPRGPEGSRAVAVTYRTAFPDLKFTVDEQIAEGDRVVTRWTARGTHTGPLPGMPITGKSAVVTGISIERYAGGKIAESRVNWDFMGMLQQLGIIPTPGA
jgi:steroid delta-isomerase-like uncharacterized protein